jgi:hypothetical protein
MLSSHLRFREWLQYSETTRLLNFSVQFAACKTQLRSAWKFLLPSEIWTYLAQIHSLCFWMLERFNKSYFFLSTLGPKKQLLGFRRREYVMRLCYSCSNWAGKSQQYCQLTCCITSRLYLKSGKFKTCSYISIRVKLWCIWNQHVKEIHCLLVLVRTATVTDGRVL